MLDVLIVRFLIKTKPDLHSLALSFFLLNVNRHCQKADLTGVKYLMSSGLWVWFHQTDLRACWVLLKISFLATSLNAHSPSKPPRLCQECAGLSSQLFEPPIMPDSVGQKVKRALSAVMWACRHYTHFSIRYLWVI